VWTILNHPSADILSVRAFFSDSCGLFILHIGYMWAVYNYLTNLDVKTGLVIILAEVAVIFLTIFAVFGTKSLMSRS